MYAHTLNVDGRDEISSRSPYRAWDGKKLSDVSSTLSTAACISSLNLSVTLNENIEFALEGSICIGNYSDFK